MTLCIAATCQERGKGRIVIASDWQAETPSAGAEIQDKLYWIYENCPVLIAGTVSRAIELKDTYRQTFAPLVAAQPTNPINPDLAIDTMKVPLLNYKRKLAAEYIGTRFGIAYEEFLEHGRVRFGEDIFREMMSEISRQRQESQLLIATFFEGEPSLFRVEEWEVISCENFATIGSGAIVAESVLFQRQHEECDTLATALYNVFEAMKLGGIAPGVGKDPTISVIYPPSKEGKVTVKDVSSKGTKYLQERFRDFGPKPCKKLIVKDEFLEPES